MFGCYVSKNGSDGNRGEKVSPFATLEKAVLKARESEDELI